MLHRPRIRRIDTASIARTSRALLAVSITAGIYVQSATVPALADEAHSADAYLADLVHKASEKQQEVEALENKMGGLRESANKSRVDLDKAQKEAQEAQDQAVEARSRLGHVEKDVSKAQDKLDDIARSAYKQNGEASPVVLAAGQDAAADSLDRASYIRLATEEQQGVIDKLDLSRTQTANEESKLRTNRADADTAVQRAVGAFEKAQEALTSSQTELKSLSSELANLKTDHEKTLQKLKAAKSAVETLSNQKPKATSFEKRRVAEKAVSTTPDRPEKPKEDSSNKTEATSSKAPAIPTEKPAAEDTPEGPELAGSAGPVEEYSGTEEGLPPSAELPDIPETFAQSSLGDDQRQSAIDGLINASGAALVAGANAHLGGNPDGAGDAALQAGRHAAGEAYDALVSPNSEAPEAPATEESAQETEPSDEAVELEPESEMPDDNPAQEATDQGVLVDPDSGVQEATPGEMEPVAPAENSNLPPAETGVDTSGTAEEKIERVIDRAMSQLDVQYAWGGGDANGPTLGIRDGGVADMHGDYNKIGFDCSGLTLYAFAAVGIQLDHYTGYQYQAGRQIPTSEAKRGDLFFWGPGASQHVAIYLGDGKMLEAPQSGDVVKISDVRYEGMTEYAVRLIE